MEIVSSALKSREEPGQILEALDALVRDAQCYQTPRGDDEPTAEGIRELCMIDANQEARA
jgi:hypothetical protein